MKEDKRIIWGIWVFTALVFALVIILHELPQADGMPELMKNAPGFHAFLNGTCAILLLTSLWAIKNKNIALHKTLNSSAMVLSLVFLLSYVVFHYFSGDTHYRGEHMGVYLFVLLTHIPLAGLSLPFILLSYYRGLTGDIAKHKRLVRFTYPVWLYVCITGVMVYLFLKPYYAF
jgi:putative membrane protein